MAITSRGSPGGRRVPPLAPVTEDLGEAFGQLVGAAADARAEKARLLAVAVAVDLLGGSVEVGGGRLMVGELVGDLVDELVS